MRIAAFAKAIVLMLAATPAWAQSDWERLITPADRQLLTTDINRLAADVVNVSRSAPRYGISVPATLALLRAAALPIANRDLAGDWRCRSIQVTGLGVYAYPFFRCRVRAAAGGWFFEKLSGSQRKSGLAYRRDPRSLVLLAGATVNEDAPVAYRSEGADHNDAGLITRIGPQRLRILFPKAVGFEMYEMVR